MDTITRIIRLYKLEDLDSLEKSDIVYADISGFKGYMAYYGKDNPWKKSDRSGFGFIAPKKRIYEKNVYFAVEFIVAKEDIQIENGMIKQKIDKIIKGGNSSFSIIGGKELEELLIKLNTQK